MKRFSYFRRLPLLLLCLFLAGLMLLPYGKVSAESPADSGNPPFKEGEILVKFKPKLSRAAAAKALPDESMSLGHSIDELNIYQVQVSSGQELAAAASLSSRSDVDFAMPNYKVHALLEPDDTYYAAGRQWGLETIHAPQAWDVTTGSSDVVIAIVDSGVDPTHEDLQEKLVPGYCHLSGGNCSSAIVYPHGTHVAGIAAAETNNAKGIAGVAWGAKIMPIRVLGDDGVGFLNDIGSGVVDAIGAGARIINMSFGLEGSSAHDYFDSLASYAYGEGALLIAAGGNCGGDDYVDQGCSARNVPYYPAANDYVVAVAATDSTDSRASYSTQASYIDIAAPGDNIYSTYLGNTYRYLSGTSMAAPFVSGLAALIWSQDSSLTPDQVERQIERYADDLGDSGKDTSYGWGRINAYRSLPRWNYLPLMRKTY